MILTVRPDPADLGVTESARLHYEAKFYLRDTNAQPPLPEFEVGEIQAYKLSKATSLIPRSPNSIRTMPWVQQFLQPGDDDLPEDGDLLDMCFLLHNLYSPSGMARAAPPLSQLVNNIQGFLQNDSLVYVKLVYIGEDYQGHGLGRALFDSFYHCLRRLPECEFAPGLMINIRFAILIYDVIVYACGNNTTLVLQAAYPGHTYGQVYEATTRAAALDLIIGFYEAIGFSIYRRTQYYDPDTGFHDGLPLVAMGRQLP